MTTTDAVPDAPVEQLAQQQAGPVPVAFASAVPALVPTIQGVKVYLVGVGVDGSLWDKWDDSEWGEIRRPVRP